MASFDLDPHELELLAEAARMLDQLDRLREAVADTPLLVDGRTNPLLIEQRLVRGELRILLSRFGFDDATDNQRRARHAAHARWHR